MQNTKRFTLLFLSLLLAHSFIFAQADPEKMNILPSLDAKFETYAGMADQIWEHAELAFPLKSCRL